MRLWIWGIALFGFSLPVLALENPTLYADIFPLVRTHCATCHYAGSNTPFPLETAQQIQKRARQLVDVVESRLMPPWLPDPAYGSFKGVRRLEDAQVRVFQQWMEAGFPSGQPLKEGPPPKVERPEWSLGTPDLILEMPEPFYVPSEGKDLYRNFVIPIPTTSPKEVRAVEFQPRNPAAHHAFIYLDSTRQSRRLAGKEDAPGFSGMRVPDSVRMPEGHFLSWQPGKRPATIPNLTWHLKPGTDLVLQMHLNATGKEEQLQARVGLYFSEEPGTLIPFKLELTSLALEIPPGVSQYRVQDSFRLPVDVEVISILPHAHYLCRDMKAFAILPDGTREWLIWIPQWDFNWQGDFIYEKPISLPAGSLIFMDFTYDNSEKNPFNPYHPPQTVLYGPQSNDEMAELWLQVVLKDETDRRTLSESYHFKTRRVLTNYGHFLLQRDPLNTRGHLILAQDFLFTGNPSAALEHYRKILAHQPNTPEALLNSGTALLQLHQWDEAETAFRRFSQLDPSDHRSFGSLGLIYLQKNDLRKAELMFRKTLRLNPDDPIARENLQRIQRIK